MDTSDRELLDLARKIIEQRYRENQHQIGAALQTKSGKVFTAVHLEATVGRIAVCAEAVALGMAAATGDTEIEMIVAVDAAGRVVSPCGMCRELISDYSPSAQVIVPAGSETEIVPVAELLPNKYRPE